MLKKLPLPLWTIALPILAWLAYFLPLDGIGTFGIIILTFFLIGSVLSAVHHAEVVAHKVGEPFGTLILALAVTTIEVSLIVSLMLTGGPGTEALARDTVFAAVMIILTGMVGICLLAGGVKFKQQRFSLDGVKAALVALTAISVLTLVLPNHTTSVDGPFYTKAQLIFVSIISLILYGTFVLVQTVRHRDFFLPPDNDEKGIEAHAEPPTGAVALSSGLLLLVCLGIVVLLAKALAPDIENAVISAGAPKMLVGVIIAAVVLLPEGLAAYRAARKNRLQTSLNLALGSALATIGLTIPAVAIVSLVSGMTITLGIDTKSVTLLLLSLFTIMLSLGSGRTNILQGVVLLTIFAAYLFTIVAP